MRNVWERSQTEFLHRQRERKLEERNESLSRAVIFLRNKFEEKEKRVDTLSQEVADLRNKFEKKENRDETLSPEMNDLRIELEEKEERVQELEKQSTYRVCQCIVCGEEKNIALLPCGHVPFCADCEFEAMMPHQTDPDIPAEPWPTCPLCRTAIEGSLRIYL